MPLHVYGDDHSEFSIIRSFSRTPGYLTHTNQPKNSLSIQRFGHFRSDCIIPYAFVTLQCYFGCSDSIFFPQMYHLCVECHTSDRIKILVKITPFAENNLFISEMRSSWLLVYLTMLHFCRRDRNVCQNTSLACQYLESSFCPNSPTLHFGSFIMRAADFDTQRAARAKKFGLCSAAWATFFARIAAFTS